MNKLLFENAKTTPHQIANGALCYHKDFQTAYVKRSSSSLVYNSAPKQNRSQARWILPDSNLHKLNVDASVPRLSASIDIGAIIRDSSGSVKAALAQNLPGNFTVKEAEAIALRLGLSWALDVKLPIHFVESDAKAVVQALEKHTSFKIEFGAILSDVSSLLSNFSGVKLSLVCREANMAAHSLATYALSIDDKHLWLDDFPPSIESVIKLDIS